MRIWNFCLEIPHFLNYPAIRIPGFPSLKILNIQILGNNLCVYICISIYVLLHNHLHIFVFINSFNIYYSFKLFFPINDEMSDCMYSKGLHSHRYLYFYVYLYIDLYIYFEFPTYYIFIRIYAFIYIGIHISLYIDVYICIC